MIANPVQAFACDASTVRPVVNDLPAGMTYATFALAATGMVVVGVFALDA